MDFDHELANLSRGKYQIQIQARSPFSPWSRSIMLPAFTILPPFWERWWVQYPLFGGGAFLFGLLVFTGYRIRLNRIRMRNQLIDANLTALRAQIRPHFIANIINSVQIYFLNNKKEDAIVFLGTFGKMVRRILDTSEEEFITVSEELKQIREYLDFECRRTSRKIDYEIRFPDDMNINYIYLPTMLLQPILENAMIHGLQVGEITEGSVEIQFLFIQEKGQKLKKNEFNISLEGRMLVSISDTGIGRAASSIKKHSSSRSFGVKSIQNRLKWISEKFDCEAFAIVEDLKNKYEEPAGTMVTLNLPLFIKDPFASID
jgi:LytS/YehU family sensor histidine kinase